MQVNSAVLTLSEDIRLPELADEAKVLALELGGLEAEASLLEGELSSDITAADIMAHDLSSLHLGTSDTILMRWSEGRAPLQCIWVLAETQPAGTPRLCISVTLYKSSVASVHLPSARQADSMVHAGDTMAPQPSLDLPSPFADPLSSFLLSHSTAAEDAGEPEPALHVTLKGLLARNSSQSPLEVLQVAVVLQPLQLHYQSSCFARLSNILASPTRKSRTAELMDVISAHESLAVQSLSVAELACRSQPVPAVSLEVVPRRDPVVRSPRLEAAKTTCVGHTNSVCSDAIPSRKCPDAVWHIQMKDDYHVHP